MAVKHMKPTRAQRRAHRRAHGKRKLRREARRDIARVIELDRAGYSPSSIAASVGLREDVVQEILEHFGALEGEGA